MFSIWAILRDSYREAVDGFVVYVMLGLSLLAILIIGSISFEPVGAERVLPRMVKGFTVFIPNKGNSNRLSAMPLIDYSAQDIQQTGSDIKFTLLAKQSRVPGLGISQDPMRVAAAAWANQPKSNERMKQPLLKQDGGMISPEELTKLAEDMVPEATPEQIASLRDETIDEFIGAQLYAHIGIRNARVKRLANPEVGTYAFEVEAKSVTSAVGWPQKVGLFFGSVSLDELPLGLTLFVIEDRIVNGVGAAVTLLICIIFTSFFIPNMLRKGALDLLIAKPISRFHLLLAKYIGGCIFMLLVTTFTIGGVWLVLGLRSGHWDPRFLVAIVTLTFTFALLYSVSTLVAVYTRSAIAAMLITICFAFVLYLVGQAKTLSDIEKSSKRSDWSESVHTTIDLLNTCLPRYKDIDKISTKFIADATRPSIESKLQESQIVFPSWYGTIGLSLGYIALYISLAYWRFATRDG